MSDTVKSLEAKVRHLEERLMFQEDNVDILTKRCAEQDHQINTLTIQLRHLAGKMKQMAEQETVDGFNTDQEVPPHY